MKLLSPILLLLSPLLSLSTDVVTVPFTISDWDVSAYLKAGEDYAEVDAVKGLEITFTYTQGEHSVVSFDSSDAFEYCQMANATVLADTSTTEYVLSSTRNKPFRLASGVGGECAAGSKIKIKYEHLEDDDDDIYDTEDKYCNSGSTVLNSFLLQGKGKKSPAKNAKKCQKACQKKSSCKGGEWLKTVTGKGSNKVKTRSCTLYSDAPTPSEDEPEEKRTRVICFYPNTDDDDDDDDDDDTDSGVF